MDTTSAKSATLALTCACGAYLEIDANFAGQTIQCPDCQKPLEVPSLEHRRTSGYALASFLTALIGAFTLVGPLLAVGLGLWGLRHIAKNADRLAGKRLAQAGIVCGAVFFALGLVTFFWAERVGLDGWLREFLWAGQLDYNVPDEVKSESLKDELILWSFKRPGPKRWGIYRFPDSDTSRLHEFILVQPRDDAYLTLFQYLSTWDDKKEVCQNLAKSDLVALLNRRRVTPPPAYLIQDAKCQEEGGLKTLDMEVDMTLAGVDRTFFVRVVNRDVDSKTVLLAGATSKHRFAKMKAQFDKMFKTPDFHLPH